MLPGKPFPHLMRQTVLDRLGMKHSTFQQPLPKSLWTQAASGHLKDGEPVRSSWYVYPEMARTGLLTTPSDLARFAIEWDRSTAGKSNKSALNGNDESAASDPRSERKHSPR